LGWREGTATFLVFAVGAAIALIGQTYHLPGDLGSFLLILDVTHFTVRVKNGLGVLEELSLDGKPVTEFLAGKKY
jgi:hypothetical protein